MGLDIWSFLGFGVWWFLTWFLGVLPAVLWCSAYVVVFGVIVWGVLLVSLLL